MDGSSTTEPIGLQVTRTGKVVGRAFDAALGEAGGTLPMWQVLVSVKSQSQVPQRQLARAAGIEGPTLTHHLNRMETAGYVTRTRDPQNRRVHRVTLTRQGERMFRRLLTAVVAFDRRLRTGLDEDEIEHLGSLLARLRANVGAEAETATAPAPATAPTTQPTTTPTETELEATS